MSAHFWCGAMDPAAAARAASGMAWRSITFRPLDLPGSVGISRGPPARCCEAARTMPHSFLVIARSVLVRGQSEDAVGRDKVAGALLVLVRILRGGVNQLRDRLDVEASLEGVLTGLL